MLTEEEIDRTVSAGRDYALTRDFPDPIGWADLSDFPQERDVVIDQRASHGYGSARVHRMTLPKAGTGQVREMAIVDPYDDVMYRGLVGRLSRDIEATLGPEVTSGRLLTAGSGWRMRTTSYANSIRRATIREWMAADEAGGVGVLDVARYYPSVSLEKLRTILCASAANHEYVDDLIQYLESFSDWNISGLPVGPEASALLGNMYLTPLDAALASMDLQFERYSDDVRIFLPDVSRWPYILQVVRDSLAALGLQLNEDKVRLYESLAEAEHALVSSEVECFRQALEVDPRHGLALVEDRFRSLIESSEVDSGLFHFLLGVLKNRRSPVAARALECSPKLLKLWPRGWSDYLRALKKADHLDIDFAFEALSGPFSAIDAAGAYHLYRYLSNVPLDASRGGSVFSYAIGVDEWLPVRCAAVSAWANSKHFRVSRACEAALSLGDLQQRRLLTLSLKRASGSRQKSRALSKISSTIADCRPAAGWAAAA